MEKNKADIESQLLLLTRQFLFEQESNRAVYSVTLDASLERELGIDSLGKVELFHRIEKFFGVTFRDVTIAESDNLNMVVLAIMEATPLKKNFQKKSVAHLESVVIDLSKIETIHEALVQYAIREPHRPHIYLKYEEENEKIITYGGLLLEASKIANGFIEKGLKPNDTVAIMLPTSAEFFQNFLGVLLAGGVPVPIYPPFRLDRIEEYAIREAGILNNAEARFLVTFAKAELLSKILQSYVPSLKYVTTTKNIMSAKSALPKIVRTAEDAALLQYTSGSTGNPKGILLCHKNILANLRSAAKAIELKSTDVAVSWLPLYHDMGLMSWIISLYFGMPITIFSPLAFLNRPERWLWSIHYHRGTLSAAPNFAYELCVKKISDETLEGLDLSSWRLCLNGAEAVNIQTLRRFYERFKRYGLKKTALFPVYGLAENTVALAMPPLNREFLVDRVERIAFEKEKHAIPTKEASQYLEFASEGVAIPDHAIRIVNEDNQVLAERFVGSVQFSGPSAMSGYYNQPKATAAIYHNGWWDTGDYGYIANGELYITGRKKDVIIKAGRNIYPETIEEVVGSVSGVRKGCVIALGIEDKTLATEKLVVVAESKLQPTQFSMLSNMITEQVAIHIGVPPDQVVIVAPGKIPKTSSGKLQRAGCKAAFLEGKLTRKSKAVPWQISKLYLFSILKKIVSAIKISSRLIYTLYVLLLFAVTVVPLWFAVFLTPRKWGAHFVRWWGKLLLLFAGCPIQVENEKKLKHFKPVIYVANHASYTDSLVLLAILPAGTLFISKKEMFRVPLIAAFMKKLEFISVDRWEFAQNIQDTKTILKALENKNSILIFPEGTFVYATGLRPFKAGAFQLAVDANTPVCPIAIKNTRKLLRAESFLLTPTKIVLTVSDPIQPKANEWSEVTRLRLETRKIISHFSEEAAIDLISSGPDLPH